MGPEPRFRYMGATPGADANDYDLFDTTVAFPGANAMAGLNIETLVVDIAHDQAGTLVLAKSADRGTTWIVVSSEAIAVPATGTTHRSFDVLAFADCKVYWTNGGVAQTVWSIDVAGSNL